MSREAGQFWGSIIATITGGVLYLLIGFEWAVIVMLGAIHGLVISGYRMRATK